MNVVELTFKKQSGGECVYLMIRAIWNSFADLGNFSSSPGLTSTGYFVAFILFWIGSLPFLYPPVHKIRHLFTVKSFFVPVAGFAFFAWAIVKAGGIGPIVHQPSKLSGSSLGWAVVKGIMSSIANFATLIGKFLSCGKLWISAEVSKK